MNNNKVVFVTGGDSGIGRETCIRFSKEGYTISFSYCSNKKEAEETAKECFKNGAFDVFFVQLDLTKNEKIEDRLNMIINRFGKIDILVNNAGILIKKRFNELSFDEIDKLIQINLLGALKVTRRVLPHMRKLEKGIIINIASIAGIRVKEKEAVYCASKTALIIFTKALSLELPKNIRIYVVNPRATATKMTGFKGDPPQEVANIIFNVAEENLNKKSGEEINVWEYLDGEKFE